MTNSIVSVTVLRHLRTSLMLENRSLPHLHWTSTQTTYRSTQSMYWSDRSKYKRSGTRERNKEFLNVEFSPSKRYNIVIVSTYKTRWFRKNNPSSVPPMVSNIQSIVHTPSSKNPMVGEIPRNCIKKCNCLLRSNYR